MRAAEAKPPLASGRASRAPAPWARAPGHRRPAGNAAFFARAAARLRILPGVLAVSGNPVTGSLLVEHAAAGADGPDGPAALAATAEQEGLFRLLTDGAPTPPDKAPSSPLDLVSARLASLGLYQFGQGRAVGDAVENLWNGYGAAVTLRRPLVSAALVGIGLYQALNGQLMGSGVSLLYYALSARHMVRTGDPEAAS